MAAIPTVSAPSRRLGSIDEAVAGIAAGRPVVVLGDERLGEPGVLAFAADRATPSLVAFVVRYGSGFIRVTLPEAEADRLQLPPMTWPDHSVGAGDTVAVDAREGVTTGISAADRARTIALLADPGASAGDFTRPGHVVPVRANNGGVLCRRAHAEAALDLVSLAGRRPAAGWSDIVSERRPVGMAAVDELRDFASRHDLVTVSIDDIVEVRLKSDRLVNRASARVPLRQGTFTTYGYSSTSDGREHIAFVFGEVDQRDDVVVRVHFECPLGDIFGALDCDCQQFLADTLQDIASAGRGVLVYIRKPAGRQIDLQYVGGPSATRRDGDGRPTGAAKADARDTEVVAHVLLDLGVRTDLAASMAGRTAAPACRKRTG